MIILSSADLQRLDAALARLRRVWESPAVKRAFADRLGRGVEPGLIRTLRALEASDEDEPGVGDVALWLSVDTSTASRLIDQAVVAGYAARRTSSRDRRRSVLSITPQGMDLLSDATAARSALLADLFADWPPQDVSTLAQLLERFAESLHADRSDRP